MAPPLPGAEDAVRPDRPRRLRRKYDVLWLTPDGGIGEMSRVAPAEPGIEASFAAFARGTLFATDRGPVAVEDLLPGDRLRTTEEGFQPLLWRGSTTLVPGAAGQNPLMGRLTRVAADALGIARPMTDLVLGPLARLHMGSAPVRQVTGGSGAFLPVRDLIDGVNIVEITPPSAVEVFHLGLPGHMRILAGGVELESHHPGTLRETGLGPDDLQQLLNLLPHREEFPDFGPLAYPRLRAVDLEEAGVGVA